MSRETVKHPGLNLGAEHGKDHDAAEAMMFGFWLFLMSDAILFGMVFATYITSVHATAGGPGPRDLYDIKGAFIETLLLLGSSFSFGMASLALKYQHGKARLIGWLAVTLALGIVFLGFELHDFSSMFAKGGVPSRSGYLSAFFDLVPLHGLHVAAGCLWLICLVGQVARYGIDREAKLGIMRLALFWHFLDIIWIAIFSVVYLAGLTLSNQAHTDNALPDLRQQEREEFRSYVWGAGLALLLTVVPFALVHWFAVPRLPLLAVIGVFALVQVLVHFRFFLHISFRHKREDLLLIVFSALLLTIMLAGTVWIMASLALRMAMPASP